MIGPYSNLSEHVDESAKQCRICLEEESQMGDLIAPCYCKGSQQFVHRCCLDEWRATKHNSHAFTNCGTCGFEYVIEVQNDDPRSEARRLRKFRLFVARDTLAVFAVIQVAIVLLGLFVSACDGKDTLLNLFPASIASSPRTAYYICGLVLFLATLGLIGICAACCKSDHLSGPGPMWCCYVGDCHCPGSHGHSDCGNCNCDGDSGKALLIVLLVAVVILAFVGIFVGIFLGTVLFQRILQRHMKILWLRQETKKYVVKNFYGQELPRQPAPSASGDLESGLSHPGAGAGAGAPSMLLQPSAPIFESEQDHAMHKAPKELFD